MKNRVRHVLEGVITAILFFLQRIPLSGGAFTMMFPLTALLRYIPRWIKRPDLLQYEVFYLRLSTPVSIFGIMIAVVGFSIFVKATIHFLKRRGTLVTTGLYSVVRHPQYFGITLTAIGTSILLMGFWADLLVAIIGYILLANYEERHLLREYNGEYIEYKQRTNFIFPVSYPFKINELFFSISIAVLIFIVTFLSGALTRATYAPTPSFSTVLIGSLLGIIVLTIINNFLN